MLCYSNFELIISLFIDADIYPWVLLKFFCGPYLNHIYGFLPSKLDEGCGQGAGWAFIRYISNLYAMIYKGSEEYVHWNLSFIDTKTCPRV